MAVTEHMTASSERSTPKTCFVPLLKVFVTMHIVKEQATVVREAHDRLRSCLAQLLPPLEGDHCHQDGIALVRRSVKRGAPTAAVSASKIANEATRNFDEKTGVASLLRD